nr:ATP-binding protein [uncultured Anaeromusa sp.]
MSIKGINTRLSLALLLLILVTVGSLGGYLLWRTHDHTLQLLTNSLTLQALTTRQYVEKDLPIPAQYPKLQDEAQRLSAATGLRITLVLANGTVIADSWERPETLDNHSNRPEVSGALEGHPAQTSRYSDTLHENLLYVAVPVLQDGRTIGVVRIAGTLASIEATFQQLQTVMLWALLLTSLLAVLVGIRLAKQFTAPIEEITAVAREIAGGNWEKRAHIRTGDEVEVLAHTLNQLTSHLDDKVKEMAAEKHKLELILEHMENAVLLLDRYGRITSINRQGRELFNLQHTLLGQHNLQVIGNGSLEQGIQNVLRLQEPQSIELQLNLHGRRHVFQVFLAPLPESNGGKEGVLAVFHDITALQELYERQTDFVANASHELATPLTAIKGFAETLLDGALENPELSQKFISIIHTESARMHRLVTDLLQLAKLSSKEYLQKVTLQPTSLAPLFESVVNEMGGLAQHKEQQLLWEGPNEPLWLQAQADWLKQALVNLVHNAIKYTPKGGKILLKTWKEANEIHILIKDSGIGIPASELPYIFDRFFRVEKARTREAGGSGLGLSIVKFIVDMHHGRIEVQSQPDAGTSMLLHFPLLRQPDFAPKRNAQNGGKIYNIE